MKRLLALLWAMLLLTACTAPVDEPTAAVPVQTAAATRAAIQLLDFDPALISTLQSATLTWTEASDRSLIHTAALTAGDSLHTLEGILSGARRMENIPMCFDGEPRHELTLVLADGAVMSVLVSLDQCPCLRQNDVCFDFEQAAVQLTGKETNAAIYDLFGAVIY